MAIQAKILDQEQMKDKQVKVQDILSDKELEAVFITAVSPPTPTPSLRA